MRKRIVVASSVVIAAGVAVAVFLRPSPTARETLQEPAHIPAAARQVLRHRMDRHGDEMRELVLRVVLMDDDAAARIAGEIYDEPMLARPIGGDELNGLLPDRFFVLQDELKARSRHLVEALARKDRPAIGEQFGALAKSCVACHEAYLHELPAHAAAAGSGGGP
jgi:hypothetical protein